VPALNFPDSPTTGQTYAASNKTWTYDGEKWIITQYDNAMDDDVTAYIDAQVTAAKEEAIAFAILFG